MPGRVCMPQEPRLVKDFAPGTHRTGTRHRLTEIVDVRFQVDYAAPPF